MLACRAHLSGQLPRQQPAFAPIMSRPHALDTLVCGLAGLKLVVQVAVRWGHYSSWWSHSGSRGPVLMSGLVLLLMALANRIAPRFYGRHRTAVILSSKVLVLAVASKTQVRLNHPPSGRLAADVFDALLGEAGRPWQPAAKTGTALALHQSWPHMGRAGGRCRGSVPVRGRSGCIAPNVCSCNAGLRLMGCAYSGLLMFPWPLWVAQQAATLVALANLEQDCSTEVRAHGCECSAATVGGIGRFLWCQQCRTAPGNAPPVVVGQAGPPVAVCRRVLWLKRGG